MQNIRNFIKKKEERKIFTTFEKYLKFCGKGGKRGSFMDHRLPRDVVDLASYRAKGRSPFLTLRGVFPLCTPVCQAGVRKGGGAKKGNNAVRRHLSPSPRFSAFSTV